MRDIKFAVRMCAAFIAIVLILAKMQQWDDAETVHVRAAMARNT